MTTSARAADRPRAREAGIEFGIEEAVINSLFAAETTDDHRGRIDALPVDEVVKLYRRARR